MQNRVNRNVILTPQVGHGLPCMSVEMKVCLYIIKARESGALGSLHSQHRHLTIGCASVLSTRYPHTRARVAVGKSGELVRSTLHKELTLACGNSMEEVYRQYSIKSRPS